MNQQEVGATVILDRWENSCAGFSGTRILDRIDKAYLVIMNGTALDLTNNEGTDFIAASDIGLIAKRHVESTEA